MERKGRRERSVRMESGKTRLYAYLCVHPWLYELMPYKELDYLQIYLDRLEGISFEKNLGLILLSHLAIGSQVAIIIRAFILDLGPWTPLQRVQFFDLFYLHQGETGVNLLCVSIVSMVIYFVRIVYHTYNARLINCIIVNILFNHNSSYFLKRSILSQITQFKYRRVGICHYLGQRVKRCMNSLQEIILAAEIFFLYTHYYMIVKIGENWHSYFNPTSSEYWYSYLNTLVKLLHIEAQNLIFNSTFFVTVHTVTILTTLFAAFTLIFFTKLGQIEQILRRGRRFPSSRLAHLLHGYSSVVQDILLFNRVYFKAFLVFLITFMPWNLYLAGMVMVHGTSVSSHSDLFFYIYWLNQMIFFIGVQLVGSMYVNRIHLRIPKHLLKIDAHQRFSRRSQLKLAFHIERYHTKNRYGLTLGRWLGLVTIFQFVKYARFYIKFLMMTYKLLQ